MQDRLFEATDRCKPWIDVEGVVITTQPVQSSLVNARLLFHDSVGFTLWWRSDCLWKETLSWYKKFSEKILKSFRRTSHKNKMMD